MRKPTAPGTLCSRSDIAAILGVSRQRVHKLVDQDPDFPAPRDKIEGERTPVWARKAILAYRDRRSTEAGRRAAA